MRLPRSALNAILPPFFSGWLRRLLRRGWFHGNYQTWQEAKARCGGTGYDASLIVKRVVFATLEVKAGRAAFERDGMLFERPSPELGLLASLYRVASTDCRLKVLDFGGSLGTTYWRHQDWLSHLPEFCWDIVEQPGFVEAGRHYLADSRLRFFEDILAAETTCAHNVLLASCSLQYLEDPAATTRTWLELGLPWILLNNLPLHEDKPDRIAVQRVPDSIYPARYPVWFFNRANFLGKLSGRYRIVFEFPSEAIWPVEGGSYASTGLLLKRIV